MAQGLFTRPSSRKRPSSGRHRQYCQDSPNGDPRRIDQQGARSVRAATAPSATRHNNDTIETATHERGRRRDEDRHNWHSRANGERCRRREGRLQCAHHEFFGQAKLVAAWSAARPSRTVDAPRFEQDPVRAAADIDPGGLVSSACGSVASSCRSRVRSAFWVSSSGLTERARPRPVTADPRRARLHRPRTSLPVARPPKPRRR